MTTALRGPSASAHPTRGVTWSPDAPPVMSNGTATLRWGWSSAGLQPVSFEALGATYTFAAGALWLLEFSPTTLTSRELVSPLDSIPVVTQTTDEAWSVVWTVSGFSITLTVTLTGAQVEFGIGAATNESGKRWRSLYGPLIRIESSKAESEDVYTRREERVVSNFWSGCLINDPVTTLSTIPGIDAEDPNFIPGFEDENLPGYSGLWTDGPGTYMAEFGAWYDRTSSTALYWQTTDTVGRSKKWISASEGTHYLQGWQHFPPGLSDNEFDLDYGVRFEILSGLEGRQWLAAANRYRSFVDGLTPPPRWFVPTGWGSKRCREAAFVVTQNHVPPSWQTNVTTADGAASAGAYQITIDSAADPVTPGQWLNVDVSPQAYYHEVIRVEGSTLTLRTPLVADVADGAALWFSGDPNSASSAAALAKVRAAFENACEYVGVPTSKAILVDYFAFPRFGNVGGYPDTHGTGGWPAAIVDHTAAMRALGAGHVCYWLMHAIAFGSTAETVYRALSDYPQTRDDGSASPATRDTAVPLTGPVGDPDLQVPFVVSECHRKIAEFVTLLGFSGIYVDAYLGAPGDRHRTYHANLVESERGDSVKSYAEWLRGIDAVRSGVDGSGEGSFINSGTDILTDALGRDLSPGTTPFGVTSDDLEVFGLAEVYLETAPGVLACSGPDVIVASGGIALHSGQAQDVHTLSGGANSVLEDGAGNEITVASPVRFDSEVILTSENPTWNGLDRFDMSPHKSEFPLDFGLVPFTSSIGTALGGRSQAYNLTDNEPNARIRSDDAGEDIAALSAGTAIILAYQQWLAGFITSVILFNESDSMDVAEMNPSGGLQTYERRVSEVFREFAQWDLVEKVRRYRREGGRHVWSEWGKGRMLDAWHGQTTALFDTDAVAIAADAFESDDGLLVAVGNLPYLDDLDRDATVTIDGDELTLPGSSVFEIAKDGTETEVAGAITGGNLTLTVSLDAREIRLFEVRA